MRNLLYPKHCVQSISMNFWMEVWGSVHRKCSLLLPKSLKLHSGVTPSLKKNLHNTEHPIESFVSMLNCWTTILGPTSSWLNFGRLFISRNASTSFMIFQFVGIYIFIFTCILMIIWFSLVTVVMSLFSFLILLIHVIPSFWRKEVKYLYSETLKH